MSNPYINASQGCGQGLEAGEAISAGEAVMVKDDGKVYLADADDADLRPAVGIAEADAASGAAVEIKMRGRVTNESGLTEGKPVYLSAATAGDLTQAPPGYAQVVGIAISATDYVLCIQPPVSLSMWTGTVAGDITSSDAANVIGAMPLAGKVLDVGIYAANTGTDGDDDLSIAGDVNIAGTTCMTTLPALSKAAADGADTFAAGTGITVGVVDSDENAFDRGELLTFDLDLTRTTPSDEVADVTISVLLGFAVE